MLWGTWAATMRHIKGASFNRHLLLGIYVAALLLWPLAKSVSSISRVNAAITMELPELSGGLSQALATAPEVSFLSIVIVIFYIVAASIALYYCYGTIKLLNLRRRSRKIVLASGRGIRIVKDGIMSPFTFMGEIYIPADMAESCDATTLILHESAHASHRHWIDLMIAHVVCVLQWYNPAAWKMLADVKCIHEYEADAEVLMAGVNPRSYQLLLLNHAIAPAYSSITDNFNQSSLKSRIIMMYKPTSSPLRRLRALALIPVAALAFFAALLPATGAFAQEAAKASEALTATDYDQSTTEVFETVEVMPEFPGGITALMKYLSNNIRYPEKAQKEQVEGRVVTSFIITKEGKVNDVKVMRSVSPELDAEAIRVVSSLPAFTPGMNDGKPVNCSFVLPITFKLESSNEPAAATANPPAV